MAFSSPSMPKIVTIFETNYCIQYFCSPGEKSTTTLLTMLFMDNEKLITHHFLKDSYLHKNHMTLHRVFACFVSLYYLCIDSNFYIFHSVSDEEYLYSLQTIYTIDCLLFTSIIPTNVMSSFANKISHFLR